MPRDLATDFKNAVKGAACAPVYFCKMEWSVTTLRLWNGVGDIVWGSQTWNGVGTFGGFDAIVESDSLFARAVTFMLSGIPSDIVSLIYTEKYRGRPAKLYLGALNMATYALVADPKQIFDGYMESLADVDDGRAATICMRCESSLFRATHLSEGRFTEQGQKSRHSDDFSGRHVPKSNDAPIDWGSKGY